ncbi:MAG: DUF4252 domain-containing protein [Bacteroidales bacterium]|jgi:hypothetical protein|nr:DUF4252 domain-containing protein [Bacteroidales bacterium]MCI1786157.1 DUF4252 domain-containing protein [Bacteroidales bacterium]
MKKIIVIIAALLLTDCLFAQSARSIYDKYSGMNEVEAVYISPAMFRMIGKLPSTEIDGNDVDFTNMVRNLRGLYVLEFDNSTFGRQLRSDVESMVRKGRYEKLLEAKEDGEITLIYALSDGEICKSLIILSLESGETDFVCIDGDISFSSIRNLNKQKKINEPDKL